jgi:IS5 family transposase
VTDSIGWRLFCRIGIDGRVPHPTTLMKITTRCGSEVMDQLNEALLAKAAEGKVLRTGRVRADTTVVAANVQRPTDSGLLAKAIGAMNRQIGRIKTAGAAARTPWRDRTRAAGRRARQINSRLRLRQAQTRDENEAVVLRITGELADLAAQAARTPRPAWSACMTPDARPIRRGRLGHTTEFRYKAQVVDNDDGVIVDHTVEPGNPADAPQLAPAIARVTRRAGQPPGAVTADRGYGEARVDTALHELGVRTVAIPRKGTPGPARRTTQHRRPLLDW